MASSRNGKLTKREELLGEEESLFAEADVVDPEADLVRDIQGQRRGRLHLAAMILDPSFPLGVGDRVEVRVDGDLPVTFVIEGPWDFRLADSPPYPPAPGREYRTVPQSLNAVCVTAYRGFSEKSSKKAGTGKNEGRLVDRTFDGWKTVRVQSRAPGGRSVQIAEVFEQNLRRFSVPLPVLADADRLESYIFAQRWITHAELPAADWLRTDRVKGGAAAAREN